MNPSRLYSPRRAWFQRLVSLALALPLVAPAAARDLADLSIEELLNYSITSVSKKASSIQDSPAAVSVVTRDDVARLGLTSLPEALRLVPGLSVGRVNSNRWAVSSRGFGGEFANKLLVLVDGRAVYTPAFGGVYWDSQDIGFRNLEHIEVIRGPGATLWGANAVNGVINISTLNAKDTQGLMLSTLASTEEAGVFARYGGRLAPNVFYRADLQYTDHSAFVDATGGDTPDAWDALRASFRIDGGSAASGEFTLLGSAYRGHSGEHKTRASLVAPHMVSFDAFSRRNGGHLLARWGRELGPESRVSVQTYYDFFDRNIGEALNREQRDTFDVEVQHSFGSARHGIVWGAGYRWSADWIPSHFGLTWTPERERTDLFNVFVQDEIKIAPERLHLIVGTKAEHHEHTGWEIQPNIRARWTPAPKHTLWAAVSRALRTPSRFERTTRLNVSAFRVSPQAPPFLVSLFGNEDAKSEELLAHELGYRFEPARNLALEVSAYHNRYDGLLQFVTGPDRFEALPAPAHVLVSPSTMQNVGSATTNGIELSTHWRPAASWKLSGSYTWTQLSVRPNPEEERETPRHQFQLRSYHDLPYDLQLNASLAHVSELTGIGIPAYTRFDLGLRWMPRPSFELGVWGHNLLDSQHPEFTTNASRLVTEVPRSVSARAVWKF